MSGQEPAFDNAVLTLLDAIKGLPPAVALRALQWSIELADAVLEATSTGRALETLIDLAASEIYRGFEEVLGALLDIEPDVLTAKGIAQAALKVKLRECAPPTTAEQ